MRSPSTKHHLKCRIKKYLLALEQLQKSQFSYDMDCSRTITNRSFGKEGKLCKNMMVKWCFQYYSKVTLKI